MGGIVGAVGVQPPAAGDGVAVLRDRDALVVRPVLDVRPREVGDDPPLRHLVVDHRRIAVVARVARRPRSRTAPQRGERERRQRRAAGLRPDADRRVDGLDVVGLADVTHGVGRPAAAPRGEVEAGEVDGGGGHARRRLRNGRRSGPPRLRLAALLLLVVFPGLDGRPTRERDGSLQPADVTSELLRLDRSLDPDDDVVGGSGGRTRLHHQHHGNRDRDCDDGCPGSLRVEPGHWHAGRP